MISSYPTSSGNLVAISRLSVSQQYHIPAVGSGSIQQYLGLTNASLDIGAASGRDIVYLGF